MLNTSGFDYITTSEAGWMKKYLQDKNPEFAKLADETKNRIVSELLAPHMKEWLFVRWKSIIVFAVPVLLLAIFLRPFGTAILIMLCVVAYGLLWVKKLHTLAMSDQTKLLISKG